MSDPVRLVILKNLTTLLQTVTFEDGIGNTHSLTGKVYRGRTTVGADVTPPFVTVLESPETSRFNDVVGTHEGSLQRNDWILLIQGCVQATDDDFNWTGDNHPTDDAHRFMAKVKMVIGSIFDEESDDYLLGVAAIEGGSCDPGIVRDADPKVSSYPFFWLRLTLSVIEKRGDPFAI